VSFHITSSKSCYNNLNDILRYAAETYPRPSRNVNFHREEREIDASTAKERPLRGHLDSIPARVIALSHSKKRLPASDRRRSESGDVECQSLHAEKDGFMIRSKPKAKIRAMLIKQTLILFFFACLFAVTVPTGAAHADEVTLSYTASTLTFLPAKIALDQKFFRQEGLDVKLIQMRTAAAIPALANGHIDYTMSFLPPIDSALRGVPIQMLAVFVDRSLHYLVAKPDIKSSSDLRGKTFALNTVDLNGSTGLVFQAVLRHFGLDPLKEVRWISAADSPALFTMVEQGVADATFLVPPWPQKARTAGLKVLFRAGDVYSAPLAGLSTFRRTLKEKPDQVRRMLRALVRATRFIMQPANQQAVAASVQQWLKMPLDEGTQALKDVTFAYSDGVPRNEKSFWDVIGSRAKLLSSSVPLSEVADFALVKEVRTP